MKRIVSVFLLICMLLLCVSCTNGNGSANTNNNNGNVTNSGNNSTNNNGNVTNSGNNSTPTPEPTAYEKLNDSEKLIFDALMIKINSYYSPSDVRVLQAGAYFGTDNPNVSHILDYDNHSCYLQIQSTTQAGTTINKWIDLTLERYAPYPEIEPDTIKQKGDFYEYKTFLDENGFPLFYQQLEIVNVGNINRALKEHWENMGIE